MNKSKNKKQKMLKYLIIGLIMASCLGVEVAEGAGPPGGHHGPPKDNQCTGFIQLDSFTREEMKKAHSADSGMCVEECPATHPSELVWESKPKNDSSETHTVKYCVPEGTLYIYIYIYI